MRKLFSHRRARFIPWLAAIGGGLLQATAFPPLEWSGVAWIAFIPWLLTLPGQTARGQFMTGWLAGMAFWMLSIHWLTQVTVAGWVVLSAYCGLYHAFFALMVGWMIQREYGSNVPGSLSLLLVGAAGWAGLEYLRSTLFTGFPWNPLGVSQARHIALIQHASWGGVYALSFLVALVNLSLALTVRAIRQPRAGPRLFRYAEFAVGLGLVVSAAVVGMHLLRRSAPATVPLRAAIVQTNIPQDDKWDLEKIELIYGRLRDLTRLTLQAGPVDLVVWPETALPDDVRNSEPSYSLVTELAALGAPILAGSMDTEWRDEGPVYFNSSFLFDPQGRMVEVYDKRHLVLFGEYLPFGGLLSFVNALTPIEASFTPGTTSTVFRLSEAGLPFSVLICFEDTVAALAREAVRNGARLLINQTNDAWFDPSSASRQHMLHCIFRCVENGVPALRVANTGVSCWIDRRGVVRDILTDADGSTRFAGGKTVAVEVPAAEIPATWYNRHGDLAAQTCAAFTVALLVWILHPFRRKKLWQESF